MTCISNIDNDGNILPLTIGKVYHQWASTEGGRGMGAVRFDTMGPRKEDMHRCVDDLGKWTEYPSKHFKLIKKYYAGIGSRETPKHLQETITRIAKKLYNLDYFLRSGGAPGADTMFDVYKGSSEIYLPWDNFNGNDSKLHLKITPELNTQAEEIAKKYHPNWNALSDAAKKLMTRNTFQVLGLDLNTPSEFIVCWTKDGKASGGTGQALRMAKDLNIPIFNLYFEDTEEKLYRHLYQINNSLF